MSSPLHESPGRTHTMRLWKKLKDFAAAQPVLRPDFCIDDAVIQSALDHFLPQEGKRDVHVEYWLAHGKLAGELMALFAKKHGRNQMLYRQVGILHDADYYRHPHYGESGDRVHPAPLCEYLLERGVPAVVCLAILEHAGYTAEGTRFSSYLSAAISTCDDLATYMSCLEDTTFVRNHGYRVANDFLSQSAQEILSEVEVDVPLFPDDFHCPHRVLSNVDLFINNSLRIAESERIFLHDV